MSTLSIDVSEGERQILLEALEALRGSKPSLGADAVAAISRLQEALSKAVDADPAPRHVVKDIRNFENLMTLAPEADIWGLSISPNDRRIGTFKLSAEITTGYGSDREKTRWFVIADGLRGTENFMELAAPDREFVEYVRSKVSRAVSPDASQTLYGVFDIPLPWSFEPHLDTDERIQNFLIAAKEDSDFYIPEIHDVFLEDHASPKLRELGFANAKAYASLREENFTEIQTLIDHVMNCIRDGIGPAGEDYGSNSTLERRI